MKKYLFSVMSAAFLIATGGYYVRAQDYDKSGFRPMTEGMTLEYVNYDPAGNKIGSYIMHIKTVSGTQEKGTVIVDQYFYDEHGNPLFNDNGGNIPMEVSTGGPDGTISRMDDAGKVLKVQNIMPKGDMVSIPFGIKPGMVIPDGKIKAMVGKVSAVITTENRQVVERRNIEVPAGTFDCLLVEEKQKYKTIISKTERVETWYAPGIGCVRQSVYDRRGHLNHIQELVSVKFE